MNGHRRRRARHQEARTNDDEKGTVGGESRMTAGPIIRSAMTVCEANMEGLRFDYTND